jgi:hypothetical protein
MGHSWGCCPKQKNNTKRFCIDVPKNLSPFALVNPEISGSDRQTEPKNLDTIFMGVRIFSSLNFLPPCWLCSQGGKISAKGESFHN